MVTFFRVSGPSSLVAAVHSSAALQGSRAPARACRAMARRPPRLGLGLDLDASASSLRTSMSTDLGASYNLTNEGVRLLSASQREFHLHAAGHETRTAAERKAAAKMDAVAPNARAGVGSLGDDRPDGARGSSDRRPSADPPASRSSDDRRGAETAISVASASDGATGDMTVDVLPFDVIGAGAGGSVKRAIHVPSHTFIALKVMTVFDREKRKQLVNELRALADADEKCAHVVGFLGAYYDKKRETVCVALEFADGGSLESALARAKRPMPPVVVGDVCAQVAAGLEYLHEKKRLVHRDIKPGNVLVRRSGACKITDFGIVAQSKMMMDGETNTDDARSDGRAKDKTSNVRSLDDGDTTGPSGSFLNNRSAALKSFKGSLRYMSPERVERAPYGRAADIWSLGVMLCECALGRYPFDEQDGGVLGLALKIAQAGETGEGVLDRVLRAPPRESDDDARVTSASDDAGVASFFAVTTNDERAIDTVDGSIPAEKAEAATFVRETSVPFWAELRATVGACARFAPGDRPTATILTRAPFARRCAALAKQHPNDPLYSLGAFVRRDADTTQARAAEARAFLEHYRRLRDAARRASAFCRAAASAAPETRRSGALALERALALLAGLYRAPSCLTCASGRRARGADAVARAVVEEAAAFFATGSCTETTTSVAALPGGVEGGALVVRSGEIVDAATGRTFASTDTFLVLRVHEGWDGANGGGRFYVRNQVEKRVEVSR